MDWGLAQKHQQPAPVPWLPCLWTHKEASFYCQPPPSLFAVSSEVAEPDNGLMAAFIFDDESGFQQYPVDGRLKLRRLPGEHFQQMFEAYGVQAVSCSVHVWGAFHSGAKSPHVLPDRYLISELHRSILRNTFVPFARQHNGDNSRYQDDTAAPHHPRVVLDLLQQGKTTDIEQPERLPDCKPIKHISDESGHATASMEN